MFSICSNTGSSSSCFRFPVAILSLKSNNNKSKPPKTNLFFLSCIYVYVWYVYEYGHSEPQHICEGQRTSESQFLSSTYLRQGLYICTAYSRLAGLWTFWWFSCFCLSSPNWVLRLQMHHTVSGFLCGLQEFQFRWSDLHSPLKPILSKDITIYP